MGLGTIHPIDGDLYWIEGQWSSKSSAQRSGCAVWHTPDRIYLLGTVSTPEQRAAIHAVVSSFPPAREILLISSHGSASGRHEGVSEIDPRLPAGRHRHLRVDDLGEPGKLELGSGTWTGWIVHEGALILLLQRSPGADLGFYLPRRRVLALPHTAGLSDADADSATLDPRVLAMLHADAVKVLLLSSEAPWDQQSALTMTTDASAPRSQRARPCRTPHTRAAG